MINKPKKLLFGLLCVALCAMSMERASAAVIDLFEQHTEMLEVDTTNITDAECIIENVSDVIGQERDVYIEHTSSVIDSEGRVRINQTSGQASSSYLSYSLTNHATGLLSVVWDGIDDDATTLDPAGLGGIDLTEEGVVDRICTDVFYNDHPVVLRFTVWTDADHASTLKKTLPGGITDIANWIAVEFPFADFVAEVPVDPTKPLGPKLAAADFTDVGAIQMDIEAGLRRADVVIGNVTTTPEPSTCILLLLGLAGFAWTAVRRHFR